jgi:hypothetical protein
MILSVCTGLVKMCTGARKQTEALLLLWWRIRGALVAVVTNNSRAPFSVSSPLVHFHSPEKICRPLKSPFCLCVSPSTVLCIDHASFGSWLSFWKVYMLGAPSRYPMTDRGRTYEIVAVHTESFRSRKRRLTAVGISSNRYLQNWR